MNAWDERHLEEPAYEVRLAGFSEAKQALQTRGDWTVNSVLPVLDNAMFFLLQVHDFCGNLIHRSVAMHLHNCLGTSLCVTKGLNPLMEN